MAITVEVISSTILSRYHQSIGRRQNVLLQPGRVEDALLLHLAPTLLTQDKLITSWDKSKAEMMPRLTQTDLDNLLTGSNS